MKRLIITALTLFSFFASFGQNAETSVNERYFEAKVKEFAYRLHMTESQIEQFVPIYSRYCEEMHAALSEDEQTWINPDTPEDAAAHEKAKIKRQQDAQTIRLKYIDSFAGILAPKQLNQLFEVESQIQKKLFQRQNSTRSTTRKNNVPAESPANGNSVRFQAKPVISVDEIVGAWSLNSNFILPTEIFVFDKDGTVRIYREISNSNLFHGTPGLEIPGLTNLFYCPMHNLVKKYSIEDGKVRIGNWFMTMTNDGVLHFSNSSNSLGKLQKTVFPAGPIMSAAQETPFGVKL